MSQQLIEARPATSTERAKAAARFMYGVGIVAVADRKTVTYSGIASGLQAMGLGYSYRSLGTASKVSNPHLPTGTERALDLRKAGQGPFG
jgi:hypothetical protein